MATNPPLTGGSLRVSHFARALGEIPGNRVKQISLIPLVDRRKEYNAKIENYTETYYRSFLQTFAGMMFIIAGLLRVFIAFIPWLFRFVRPNHIVYQMFEWADIVQVEGPWLVSWVKRHTGKPICLIAHNVEYDMMRCVTGSFKGLRSLSSRWIVKAAYNCEQEAVRCSDIIFVVSNEDKDRMMSLYDPDRKKIKIAYNGVLRDEYPCAGQKKRSNSRERLGLKKESFIVLFSGSAHPPNVTAALFIRDQLTPRFTGTMVIFAVIGTVFPRALRQDNFISTGPVSPLVLNDWFAAADITINPITEGSGSNIKIFQYLSLELPVISTLKGARGMNEKAKRAVVLCCLDDFYKHIFALYKSKDHYYHYCQKSASVADLHDYSTIAKKVMEFYKALRTGNKKGR